MAEYILELSNVSKEFPGTKALDGVQMKLEKGSVHALVGENGAGKSTLMKCLLGIYHMDKGELFVRGKKVVPVSVKQMHEEGLSIIQQELSPVYERSVMENIWLGREPMKGIFVDDREMLAKTKELLNDFDLDIDPKMKIGDLSVAQIQMVEIIKAVSWGVDIVMMDEPTSALTNAEVDHLFRIIADLKSQGVSVIYVSHKMDEIFRIADAVTVLRDGKWIASHTDLKNTTVEQIIAEMVGREVNDENIRPENMVGEEVTLDVQGLSAEGVFSDISFQLHKGEILGFAGLVGAGRTEVLETLFGLRHKKSGTIRINGREVEVKRPGQAIKNGMALLTEERRKDGIVGVLDIMENIMVANYDAFVSKAGFIKKEKTIRVTNEYIDRLSIKTPGWKTRIENLSGGNQQKVLFARWLLSHPDIFLLDEPTRGIDIGAKSEIYGIMNELSAEGKSIVVVSSELPELLKVCDRIIVMKEGKITGILNRGEADQESIMLLCSMKNNEKEATI